MAQVNSEPGKSQTPGTVVVASGTAEVGADAPHGFARGTTVPYNQSEPGKHDPKRS